MMSIRVGARLAPRLDSTQLYYQIIFASEEREMPTDTETGTDTDGFKGLL